MTEQKTKSAEFAAAAYVLAGLDNPNGAYGWGYVDVERESIDVDRLYEDMYEKGQPWSDGERLLVLAALDLWGGPGKATLRDLVTVLDESNLKLVLDAICIRRGLMAAPGEGRSS